MGTTGLRLAAVALALLAAAPAAAPPPNVLVVLADDQGWGDVGFNAEPARQHIPGAGGPWAPNPPRTPHIDSWARDASTLQFTRAYAGSPVCSPTRASLLTGRSPDRECVFNAEGCGQQPAWACVDPMPFPGSPELPTLARSLQRAGFATQHLGKWHLGDFFPKYNPDPSFAYKKWPVMNPGMAGFADWYSTEASAASTTLNCGCDAAWPLEAPGCIIGGGAWVVGKSLECTNFWSPTDALAPRADCHVPTTANRSCVTNSTIKVAGDSTLHMLARLEAFIAAAVSASTPFFAALELHTNHVPHPSLPEFFHAYNGTDGLPAGDYLGTLSQMDAGIGVLRQLLADAGVTNSTLVVYLADNGPHPGTMGDGAGGIRDVQAATNGLRQCKASVFEGGIRVPAFISWPGVVSANRVTDVPFFAPDVFPTVLDLLGAPYPQPTWAIDGESIVGLVRGEPGWARSKPLVWKLEGQAALLAKDGRFKLVKNPEAGQCKLQNSTISRNMTGLWLFDLIADPTESTPLNDAQPAVLSAMSAELAAFEASILVSEVSESRCLPPAPPPSGDGFLLVHSGGCLGAASATEHAALTVSAANCGRGGTASAAPLSNWTLSASGKLVLAAAPTFGVHPLASSCADGAAVVLGDKEASDFVTLDAARGTLATACPGSVCVDGALSLAPCNGSDAQGWSARSAALGLEPWRARGRYIAPFD